MPKPKYDPWSWEKRRGVELKRMESYDNVMDFVQSLKNVGMKIDYQPYLRRERGETPTLADDIWYYAYALQISPLEALALYSRMPENGVVFQYATDALEHFKLANDAVGQLEEMKKQGEESL